MLSILLLGFMIGLQHALEADHVAAVASVASRGRSAWSIVRHGSVWGLGHTLTLLLVAGPLLLLGQAVPEGAAQALELAVGVMLILLGGDVLRRVIQDRIHFHVHRHGDGSAHVHAHSHAGEDAPHDPSQHDHEHKYAPVRSLLVGMMHGMAGSAALVVLIAASVEGLSGGLTYILVFGAGSIIGMAALSAVMAVPMSYAGRLMTWGRHGIQAVVGFATVAVGLFVIYDIALAG